MLSSTGYSHNDIFALNDQLKGLNKELGNLLGGDCIYIHAGIEHPLEQWLKFAIQKLKSESSCNHLIVMLQTNGGNPLLVERLVLTMRSHYTDVSFIIPSHAYSAGTLLTLSGNKIYMDYTSVLGPIDPQIVSPTGEIQSGLGLLAEIEELKTIINSNEQSGNTLAEFAMLGAIYKPSLVQEINHIIQYSRGLLEYWLSTYKFRDWTIKEGSGKPVTDQDKQQRARDIADILGDIQTWKSHGRGIVMNTLRSDFIKLKIDDFGEDPDLNKIIIDYHQAIEYFLKLLGINHCLHSRHNTWRM